MSDAKEGKSGPPKKPKRPRRRKRAASLPGPKPEADVKARRGWLALAIAEHRTALTYGGAGLGAALFLAATGIYELYGRSQGPSSGVVEVDWPAGLDAGAAAELLADIGAVKSASTMALFLKATGGTADFVAGPHLLGGNATPWDLRRCLTRDPHRRTAKVTIPEGFHRFDIGARLEKAHVAGKRAFLAATTEAPLLAELGIDKPGESSAESAEGYLFPATYELSIDSDPREVVQRLVAEADKRWQTVAAEHSAGLASLRGSLGWGRREVLTLASMIEKEAVVDEERPIIASVFFNRLLDPDFKSHKLQSDPTSMYGCVAAPEEAPSCAGYAGKATPAINVDAKNRYSTYTHARLPPGPIANPGIRSIEAVLTPAATRFFYFVAAGGGRHTFSESFDAHNDAVKKRAAATP